MQASCSFLSEVLGELGDWPATSSTLSLALDPWRFPSDLIVLVTDLPHLLPSFSKLGRGQETHK